MVTTARKAARAHAREAAARRPLAESWHEPSRQGPLRVLRSGDRGGDTLVSLADLIRWHARPDAGMTLPMAVAWVLGRIEAQGVALAVTDPREGGRMLAESVVWQRASAAQGEQDDYSNARRVVDTSAPPTAFGRAPMRWQGVAHRPELPAVPELRGASGLVALLHERWGSEIDPSKLDRHGIAPANDDLRRYVPRLGATLRDPSREVFPCVLAADAAALFGYAVAPSVAPSSHHNLAASLRFDLVQELLDRGAERVGMRAALRELLRVNSGDHWFVASEEGAPRPVGDADVWYGGWPSVRERAELASDPRPRDAFVGGVVGPAETALRGLGQWRGTTWPEVVASVPAGRLAATEPFRGVTGLRRWFAEAWLQFHAAGLPQPDGLGRLLIPADVGDAVRAACGICWPPAVALSKAAIPEPAAALHLVEAVADRGAAQREAIASLVPPQGFVKGGGWTADSRAELLRQCESLMAAGLSLEGAYIELHKAWGYSKRSDRNGGPLAKVLTRARAERTAKAQRRAAGG